ncbi:MAG: type I-E CRISPR-associated protein Cas5/CasD, partial [Chloroflexi bacterium]|nr:type I-E CRISPR-associated protein Cas5/CasD [Chloroflexota bacterium]
MNTLLIRLVAPMQSWGVESRFTVRDSGLEPSKSGVIGLICAAMGRPRQAALEDLAALRMGVRVDREGTLRNDFQIAQRVLSSAGKGVKSSVTSTRYYLSDAAFLVGLESASLPQLERIQQALKHPVWAIFLGRKAFVPSAPVWLKNGLREGESLEAALQAYAWGYSVYRRVGPALGVRAVTVYRWVSAWGHDLLPVVALFGLVRCSGVVGVDEKYVLVPKNDKPAGKNRRWMYVYLAVDVYTYDLLHIALYPHNNQES